MFKLVAGSGRVIVVKDSIGILGRVSAPAIVVDALIDAGLIVVGDTEEADRSSAAVVLGLASILALLDWPPAAAVLLVVPQLNEVPAAINTPTTKIPRRTNIRPFASKHRQ